MLGDKCKPKDEKVQCKVNGRFFDISNANYVTSGDLRNMKISANASY